MSTGVHLYSTGYDVASASIQSGIVSDGGRRGEVVGFSTASARRLRRLLLSCWVPDVPCWAITLTQREAAGPLRWRRCVDAYTKRLARLPGVNCGIWRVELQRRDVPHIHCVAWTPFPDAWRSAWLAVWGVSDEADHCAHAVHIRAMDCTTWLSYTAAHTSKHKTAQLGWRGRQWGIWGRRWLQHRPCKFYNLGPHDAYLVGQYLRALLWLWGYRPPPPGNAIRFFDRPIPMDAIVKRVLDKSTRL